MGMYQPPKYRKKNKETGEWEWVIPAPVEFGIKVYPPRQSKKEKEKQLGGVREGRNSNALRFKI